MTKLNIKKLLESDKKEEIQSDAEPVTTEPVTEPESVTETVAEPVKEIFVSQ